MTHSRHDTEKEPGYIVDDSIGAQAPQSAGEAVGLIRESTDPQTAKGTPVAIQRDAIIAKAAELGVVLAPENIYADTWGSMSLSESPTYQRFVEAAHSGRFRYAILHHQDRLAQDRYGLSAPLFFVGCHDAGTQVVTCTGPPVPVGTDPEWAAMMAHIASLGKRISVVRTNVGAIAGQRKRAEKFGLPIAKRLPMGWQYDAWPNPTRVVPNERRPDRDILLNLRRQGMAYRAIAARLTAMGMPTASGSYHPWTAKVVRGIVEHPLNSGTLYAFRRAACAPKRRVPGSKRRGKSSHRATNPEEWVRLPIPVENPPMTVAEQQRLMAMSDTHRISAKRNAKHDYLMRGVLFCTEHTGRRGQPLRMRGATTADRVYYRCASGHHIRAERVDAAARAFVTALMLMPSNVLAEAGTTEETRAELARQIEQAERQARKVQDARDRLLADHYAGTVEQDRYHGADRKLEGDIRYQRTMAEHAKEQLAALDRAAEAADIAAAIMGQMNSLESLDHDGWRGIFAQLDLRAYAHSAGGPAGRDQWGADGGPTVTFELGIPLGDCVTRPSARTQFVSCAPVRYRPSSTA
ncbi:MAG: recombinase family protein [Planctomycetota bacterium]|jgi:hypothetical protein